MKQAVEDYNKQWNKNSVIQVHNLKISCINRSTMIMLMESSFRMWKFAENRWQLNIEKREQTLTIWAAEVIILLPVSVLPVKAIYNMDA
jgi:hypothetical protein